MFITSTWTLFFIMLFLSSLTTFISSLVFLLNSFSMHIFWVLFSWGSTNISFTILLDWVSLMFMSFVLFISCSVFLYSGEYMEGEKNLTRFIYLMLAFVISMLLLILSPNLISLLLGWDGLGLVSYCLVIFYQNPKSLNAGTLTVLSNRIGDVFILVSIALLLNFGDWTFISWMGNSESLVLCSILIIMASMTKSAQIPFSAWLPAAMAAPTPVSSLVHSSTLVTAGVYLVIRMGWVYDFWLNEMLMVVSCTTMFMAGLGACFEFDLKKVIALSTLSQLGLMMYSLSLGLVKFALFHLLTHALFKALLFMSAGCIIHGVSGWQDLRMIGGAISSLPYMSSCFVISNLALSGMPFLAGFYSKDLILELSLISELNMFSLLILFLSTGLTVFYTFRLIYYVMVRSNVLQSCFYLSDGNGIMCLSTIGLTIFSIMFGATISWLVMDYPSEIFLPISLKNLTLFICFISAILGFLFSQSSYLFKHSKASIISLFIWFSSSMWFLPFLSSQFIIKTPLKKGMDMMKMGDSGWLEVYGGQNLSKFTMWGSVNLVNFSNSGIKFFIFLFWS
uniref:NADH dehydrogenase subunit 5 n=1 Tax=Conchoderma hunteri TaxID=748155 RepID=UPI0023AAB892|nr:NADH dehydrogenase subunit 5 [Conchoderma hunteri]WCJ53108.1 NADH dehydrogenase subunit 5 [Conchoderma hunteri]